MLVKELIKRLRGMPQEYPVWIQVGELGLVTDVIDDKDAPRGPASVFCDEKNAVYISCNAQEPTMSDYDFMEQVAAKLVEAGVPARFEYPGYYISVGSDSLQCFGTANGTWGWSDEGGDSEESTLRDDTRNLDAVVSWILSRLGA